MTRIERSTVIPAPVERVFAIASDYRRWEQWFEGVAGFRPTTEVERGNGARYLYTARLGFFNATVETEIHDFVENVGWTGRSTRGLPHRTRWVFGPVQEGTRFTYGVEYWLPVPLLVPVLDLLFLKRQWVGIIERSLGNLRDLVASEV